MNKNRHGQFATNKPIFALYSFLFDPMFAEAAEIKQADEANYWAWGVLIFGFVILWVAIKLYQARSTQDKAMRNIFTDKN